MVIKRHFKKLITTTLVGITVLTHINKLSYAQSKNLIFNNINIEQGISQSTIEDIFQDSEGYIWLGTNDGLNRYNGYEFKNYNYDVIIYFSIDWHKFYVLHPPEKSRKRDG